MKFSLLLYSKYILFFTGATIIVGVKVRQKKNSFKIHLISLFANWYSSHLQSLWQEFEYILIENAKTGSLITDIKVGRYNRTTITLNGMLNVTEDFSESDVCTYMIKNRFSNVRKFKFSSRITV